MRLEREEGTVSAGAASASAEGTEDDPLFTLKELAEARSNSAYALPPHSALDRMGLYGVIGCAFVFRRPRTNFVELHGIWLVRCGALQVRAAAHRTVRVGEDVKSVLTDCRRWRADWRRSALLSALLCAI